MQRTCQPFLFVLITCFILLVGSIFPGCSGDAGKTDDDGNQTSSNNDDYPLKVCVVSGEELGSMGEPYVHTHGEAIVKFCCKPCIKKFDEDPQGYLAKLQK